MFFSVELTIKIPLSLKLINGLINTTFYHDFRYTLQVFSGIINKFVDTFEKNLSRVHTLNQNAKVKLAYR